MYNQSFMPVFEILTNSGLVSLLGLRHALEPDHLAAVSTLVQRGQSGYKAALLGLCWGVGHTLSLMAVGAALLLLRYELSPSASDAFELLVALMLVLLGIRAIIQATKQGPNGPLHV